MMNFSKISEEEKERFLKDAPLGVIFKSDDSQMFNPLEYMPEVWAETPELYYTWLLSRPEYFSFTCKELMNVNIHPFQGVILDNLWKHKFPMLVAARGASKSYCLAVYCLLRILLLRNRKVIICGSGFRQSKIIFEYMENIVKNSKILSGIITENDIQHGNDGWRMKCGDSFALAIPIGSSGGSIRGLRANDIIADEFAAQQLEIFETVIAGFASVASSPTEQAAMAAKRMMAKVLGFEIEEDSDTVSGNQIIISGTAYYSFNHFSAYHDRYKKIIKTRGDKNKLRELTGDNNDFINHKDYCVIRLPVNLLPAGFMDESQIGRAKATVHSGTFDMEYMACFSSDSNGFFKRTNIEQCVVKEGEDVVQPNGLTIPSKEVFFSCRTRGDKNKQYIMGVDPAMTLDNFSIVIIELNENHRGVVYCWTTNKDDHLNKQKLGISTENNYYAYCARKIRSLIERFNIVQIALDAQGGGRAVMETINDKNLMIPGELLILPKVDFAKLQDTDMQSGLHIIDVVQFTREDWTSKSNHGMKKDFEDKVLLFPFFDAISFAEAEFKNYDSDNEDTLPKCISEIEELKSELCTITVTSTPATNRERWDTPEYKTQTGKKGRLRKDRYSALLMANMTARTMERATQYDIGATEGGGFAALRLKSEEGDQVAKGNPSIVAKLSALYL